jgi:hypothetical protein
MTSTFALITTGASLVGVPPAGAIALGLWSIPWSVWPDIDSPGATPTKMLCLLRYPTRVLDAKGKHKLHAKGPKKGRRRWVWRSFPGYPIHLALVWFSAIVYDRFATEADRRDSSASFGQRFRTHRGFCHSVWFALLSGVLAWLLLGWVSPVSSEFLGWIHTTPIFGGSDLRRLLSETAVFGTLGHLMGDCVTDYGISPVAPVVKWRGRRYPPMGIWTPLRFKVGHWVEDGPVRWACAGAVVASLLFAVGFMPMLASAVRHLWLAF